MLEIDATKETILIVEWVTVSSTSLEEEKWHPFALRYPCIGFHAARHP
jgi:hypothetical protein